MNIGFLAAKQTANLVKSGPGAVMLALAKHVKNIEGALNRNKAIDERTLNNLAVSLKKLNQLKGKLAAKENKQYNEVIKKVKTTFANIMTLVTLNWGLLANAKDYSKWTPTITKAMFGTLGSLAKISAELKFDKTSPKITPRAMRAYNNLVLYEFVKVCWKELGRVQKAKSAEDAKKLLSKMALADACKPPACSSANWTNYNKLRSTVKIFIRMSEKKA
ncbi:hypothetical protein ACFL3T_04860 [Patescibacteria group bacterium]